MSEPRGSECDWDNCPMSFVWDYGLSSDYDRRAFDPTQGCRLTYAKLTLDHKGTAYDAAPQITYAANEAAERSTIEEAALQCGAGSSCLSEFETCVNELDVFDAVQNHTYDATAGVLFYLKVAQTFDASTEGDSCDHKYVDARLDYGYQCPCSPTMTPTTATPSAAPSALSSQRQAEHEAPCGT